MQAVKALQQLVCLFILQISSFCVRLIFNLEYSQNCKRDSSRLKCAPGFVCPGGPIHLCAAVRNVEVNVGFDNKLPHPRIRVLFSQGLRLRQPQVHREAAARTPMTAAAPRWPLQRAGRCCASSWARNRRNLTGMGHVHIGVRIYSFIHSFSAVEGFVSLTAEVLSAEWLVSIGGWEFERALD